MEFRDLGTTDAEGAMARVLVQAAVPPVVEGTDAARTDPGARRKTYTGKDTPRLSVVVMGRRMSR